MSFQWGYCTNNGPIHWFKYYPQACGRKQSPIDIKTDWSIRIKEHSPLNLKYSPINKMSLSNSGHGWRVDIHDVDCSVSGGLLTDNVYKLHQFHCHWGKTDEQGSEHLINGKSYPGELHFVHWNSTKYKSFEDASVSSDGLVVLAVFLKMTTQNNELSKITNVLPYIPHKGDRITMSTDLNVENLLPLKQDFWTYNGSLTTPPCSECVTWIVFKQPIEISEEQLQIMRTLKNYDIKDICPNDEFDGKTLCNFRPTMPLGDRKLYDMNFPN